MTNQNGHDEYVHSLTDGIFYRFFFVRGPNKYEICLNVFAAAQLLLLIGNFWTFYDFFSCFLLILAFLC